MYRLSSTLVHSLLSWVVGVLEAGLGIALQRRSSVDEFIGGAMSISSAIPFARLVSVTHAAGRCATLLATVTLLAGPAMASLIVPPAQTSFGLGGGCTSTGKTIIVTGLDSDTCESVRGDPVQMQTFLNG